MIAARSLATRALMVLLLAASPAWAKKTHKKTKPKRLTADQLLDAGQKRLKNGEYDKALADFGKAAERGGNSRAFFLIGWTHYQRGFKAGTVEGADRDDAQAAIEAYRMALRLDSKLHGLADPSQLYFSRAVSEEAVGAYDDALKDYRQALRLSGKPLVALNAARLRLKMKEEDRAVADVELALKQARRRGQEKALRKAARSQPAFAPLLADEAARNVLESPEGALVAQARNETLRDAPRTPALPPQDQAVLDKIAQGDLEFKFRRYHKALAHYNDASTLDAERHTLTRDQQAELQERIGAADNKLGLADAAAKALRKSLEKKPQSPSAYYELALAYAGSNKNEESLKTLEQCFTAAADSADLRRYVLLSKTDPELEAVRSLPGYKKVLHAASASRPRLTE